VFEWEPSPSTRDVGYLDRCRFARDEAIRRALEALPTIVVNDRTAAEAVAERRRLFGTPDA
jgi:hypothetical protein